MSSSSSISSFDSMLTSNTRQESSSSVQLLIQQGEDGQQACWDEEALTEIFIKACEDELKKGVFTDGGFKTQGWNNIAKNFNDKSHKMYTKNQLMNKYTALKSQYKIFQAIKENSGFGWDEVRKVSTAPEEVWSAYLQQRSA